MIRVVHLFADEMARGIGLDAGLEIAALIGPQVRLVRAESWLPGWPGQLDHDALCSDRGDGRLICMAEVLRRDHGRRAEPLLLLPALAQERADGVWPRILAELAAQGAESLHYRIWSTRADLPERLASLLVAQGVMAEAGGQVQPAPGSALEARLALGAVTDHPVYAAPPAPDPRRYPTRKIMFVIDKLANRSGGAERVLIETANALAGRGHMVEIVSHEHRIAPPFYPLAPGVMHTNLRPPRRGLLRYVGRLRAAWERYAPDWPLLDRVTWLSRNGGFWRRLQSYIEIARPDVAIGFMPPAITALGLITPGYPLRRVASTHNVPEQDFCNPDRWDPSGLDRRRRLAVMARMDRIAVLLPEFRAFYTGKLREQVLLLPNAVAQVDSRLRAGSPRLPVVMSVGRLAPVKRHELLIEAWSQVAADFPEWELQIYGEGPLHDRLERRIAELGLETAKLMGHHKDVGARYLKASILAHPAEFEGFGLAPAEAMVAAVPVVAFEDCSGVNTLVQNGANGVLVGAEGDRATNFAAGLRSLMQDAVLRQKLAEAGPASMAIYAPEVVINLWEDMMFAPEVPRGGLAG